MAHEPTRSGVHHGSDDSRSSAAVSSSSLLAAASYPRAGWCSPGAPELSPEIQYVSEKQQSRILSLHPNFLRKPSFLTRGLASLTTPRDGSPYPFSATLTPSGRWSGEEESGKRFRKNSSEEGGLGSLARVLRPGNRPSKRLLVLIVLNLAFSGTEFLVGVLTRRIGLVSDAFHLSFGCGVLTFSLVAMT